MTNSDSRQETDFFNRIWWFWAALVGFVCGRGYEPVLNFREWHYSMFIHSNGVEEYLAIIGWFLLGPLPAATFAVIVVGCIRWWLHRKSKLAQ